MVSSSSLWEPIGVISVSLLIWFTLWFATATKFTYMVPYTYVTYLFFALFAALETCFVQLPGLNFFNWPLLSCLQPWALPCQPLPSFLSSHTCMPCPVSRRSRPLLSCPACLLLHHLVVLDMKVLFCMEELFVATVNVNIMVIACKNKQKENKSSIATWSLEKKCKYS